MRLSKEQRDKLAEFQKRRQGNNDSRKFGKKDALNDSSKDAINVSSLIQSDFDKRANKEKVEATKFSTCMDKLLILIEKDRAYKSSIVLAFANAATS